MSRTQMFRDQHQDLLDVAAQLGRLLDPSRIEAEPEAARTLLSVLAGKLKVHLSMEDNSLYPRLLSHENPDVSSLASYFQSEMGGIKAAFTEYTSRWPSPGAIRQDPEGFITETRRIFSALDNRIKRENLELYALADKS